MLGSWRRGLPGQVTGYLALCLFSSIIFLSHSVPLVQNLSSSASSKTERPSDSVLEGAKVGSDANATLLPRNTSPVLKVSIRTLSVHVPERLLQPQAAMNVKKKFGKRDQEERAKRDTLPNQFVKMSKKPCITDSKKRSREKSREKSTKTATPSAQPMKADSLPEKAKQPSPEFSKVPSSLRKEVSIKKSQVTAGLKSKVQTSGNRVNVNAQNATAIGITENETEKASKKKVAVSITSLFEVGAWEQNMKSALPWKIRSAVRSFFGRIWRTTEKSSDGSRHSSDKIQISDGHEIANRINELSGVAVPVTKKKDGVPTLKVPRAAVPVVHLSKPAAKKYEKSAVKRPAKSTVNRQIIQAAQTTQYVQSGQNPNVAERAAPSQPDVQLGQMAAVPSMGSTGFGQANSPALQSEGAQVQQNPPPSEESVASIMEEVDETETDDDEYSSPAAALVEGDTEISDSDAEAESAPAATEAAPAGIKGTGGTAAAASLVPSSETSAFRGDNITQLSNMVYKVAKEEGVHRLAVAPCRTSLKWMPDVVRKLEYEIPGFKFYCVDTWEKGSPEDGGQELGSLTLADLSAAFSGCASAEVLRMPISKTERLFPRDIDLVVSWMGMQVWGTRKAWRFIKGLRRSGTRLGLFGNDPRSKNAESDEKRRLNVRKSPMLFNEPLRVISRVGEDEEENPKQLLLYPMDGIRDGF